MSGSISRPFQQKASTRSARDDRLDEFRARGEEGRSVRGVRERIRDISILLILEPCPRVAPTRASSFGSDDKRIESVRFLCSSRGETGARAERGKGLTQSAGRFINKYR